MKYSYKKNFKTKQLKKLFESVNWDSAKYPKKLKKAMKNSDYVISVWDDNRLIGLMSAISDKAMTVYFPYLLIDPEYQGLGIGTQIANQMLEHYGNIFRLVLSCYDDKLSFYQKFGFETEDDRYVVSIEHRK